jgi:hypothetical protein
MVIVWSARQQILAEIDGGALCLKETIYAQKDKSLCSLWQVTC